VRPNPRPVAVLISGYTLSAAEVFTLMMQAQTSCGRCSHSNSTLYISWLSTVNVQDGVRMTSPPTANAGASGLRVRRCPDLRVLPRVRSHFPTHLHCQIHEEIRCLCF
jgi:hypothetical protein